MPAPPPSSELARYPAALSLPSADPSGLAVEAMLRFTGARTSHRDARIGALALTIHDPVSTGASPPSSSASAAAKAPPPQVCRGLMECLHRLSAEDGVVQLSDAEATKAVWVEVLVEQRIFPAFLFLTHFDPVVYRGSIAKSVEPKVATLWEGLSGGYRERVLRANPYFYTGLAVESVPSGRMSMAHLAKVQEVSEGVEKAFAALEALCVANGASSDAFVLATTKPTYIDALVYAAASSFFHADVGAAAVAVAAHQQRLRDACPRLLQYTERLRQHFFEAESGTYCLRPRSVADEDPAVAMAAAAEQHYRRGRLQALWWTGLFATVYFVLANADMVVALLEETLGEEDGEDAEPDAAAHPHGGSATLGEPKGL